MCDMVVVEPADTGYSAYVPDLPGCITTRRTLEDIRRNIAGAIAVHLDGMREDGEPIPGPSSLSLTVEVA